MILFVFFLMKRKCKLFHQYHQKQTITSHLNSLNINIPRHMTLETLARPSCGQAHRCGGVKPVNGIQTAIHIYKINDIKGLPDILWCRKQVYICITMAGLTHANLGPSKIYTSFSRCLFFKLLLIWFSLWLELEVWIEWLIVV